MIRRTGSDEFHAGCPEITIEDGFRGPGHEVFVTQADAWQTRGPYRGTTPLEAHIRMGAEWTRADRARLLSAARDARCSGRLSRLEYITMRARLGRRAREAS